MKGIDDILFDPGEPWFWVFWLTLPLHWWISIPVGIVWFIIEAI